MPFLLEPGKRAQELAREWLNVILRILKEIAIRRVGIPWVVPGTILPPALILPTVILLAIAKSAEVVHGTAAGEQEVQFVVTIFQTEAARGKHRGTLVKPIKPAILPEIMIRAGTRNANVRVVVTAGPAGLAETVRLQVVRGKAPALPAAMTVTGLVQIRQTVRAISPSHRRI